MRRVLELALMVIGLVGCNSNGQVFVVPDGSADATTSADTGTGRPDGSADRADAFVSDAGMDVDSDAGVGVDNDAGVDVDSDAGTDAGACAGSSCGDTCSPCADNDPGCVDPGNSFCHSDGTCANGPADCSGPIAACDGFPGYTCGATEYCSYGLSWAPCGGGDDTGGVCVARPTDCSDDCSAPVCGCDGTTYCNECQAHASGARIAASGACSSR